MRTPTTVIAIAVAIATFTSAKEVAVNTKLKGELFDSGVRHEQILALKTVSQPAGQQMNPHGSKGALTTDSKYGRS